ncbi:arylamine N-acetyltransferase family protein [Pseudonocardia spirodelae]|uniref:Arylamine N-acetyltransferase n=1 Tax=Pseudonocardia spirodelae TaxID=3133431 RepID=A0ABU8TCE4_9PSEU
MTISAAPAVAAHLDRIGVAAGPPDVAQLDRIVRAHTATVAFENLDPFTGTDPPVDPAGVTAKLVHGRRGGWCFEHNLLLHDTLRDLGHAVTPLVARVRLGLERSAPATSRTHRLTLVTTSQGRFTVDGGFGATVPTAALRLVTGLEQPTGQAVYRYDRDAQGTWVLQRRGSSGGWTDQYAFDLLPAPDVDFRTGSWHLTHHPESGFRTGLTAALVTPRRRTTLDGTRLTVRPADGPARRRELDSPAQVRAALEDELGIDTGGVAGLERRLRAVYFS